MYCTKCGADMGDNPVCLQCGQPAETDVSVYHVPEETSAEEVTEESVHRHAVRLTLAGAMSAPLLIAAGILVIVTAVLNIVLSGRDGLAAASLSTIITILIGAGLLSTALTARSRMDDYTGQGSGLLRVMLMIEYVLGWVAFGFMCLALILLLAFRSVFAAVFDWIVTNGGMNGMPGFTLTAYGGVTPTLMLVAYWSVIAVLAVSAIFLFLYTLFYLRGRVVMGRDIMTSLQEGHFYVSHVRAVRGWSLALAIVSLLGGITLTAAGSLSFDQGLPPAYGITNLTAAAAHFLIYLWIGRHFIPKN
ncbi:MAG: hypothetical protein IKH56_01390 [Oscillospiraceae bacterium]|nr:hypothetical protein [Oscillospiraceae bacterium]